MDEFVDVSCPRDAFMFMMYQELIDARTDFANAQAELARTQAEVTKLRSELDPIVVERKKREMNMNIFVGAHAANAIFRFDGAVSGNLMGQWAMGSTLNISAQVPEADGGTR